MFLAIDSQLEDSCCGDNGGICENLNFLRRYRHFSDKGLKVAVVDQTWHSIMENPINIV